MTAVLKKRALAEYSQNVLIKSEPEDDVFPAKKLKTSKKQWPMSSSGSNYIGMLSKCKSSNEALQLLLRVSESSSLQPCDITDVINKLVEHIKVERESVVRTKILSLFIHIAEIENVDINMLIDEIIEYLKSEESHKVIAQGLTTLLVLGRNIPSQIPRLMKLARQYLKDTSNVVKSKCLELIGSLAVTSNNHNKEEILSLVSCYIISEDARVRSKAIDTLILLNKHDQYALDLDLYQQVCKSMTDDYENVRLSAINYIALMTQLHPQHMLNANEEELRLVDDAFGKVCLMVCDLSTRVRTVAIAQLGNMKTVSQRFLQQTLDKKLMSNMRLKKSAHERARENIASGEWASGAKWADDAPRELLNADSINLMAAGSCGVLVHALEDEFQEVRIAGVDTLCNLALDNSQFAMLSLDFLVDMFNDEIEEVRLRAIESLTMISSHIVLREDQLETMLGALKDFSLDVREALHKMLSSCRLSNKDCLQMIVESLLENLKKYPQDKKSTWRCFQKAGELHPDLVLPLVPELLAIHPFFDTPEPDVEDPAYICVLILIFNAAKNCPTMIAILEEHTLKHYSYLRDTMTSFVPQLKLSTKGNIYQLSEVETCSTQFIQDILTKMKTSPTNRVRRELMMAAEKDLSTLAESDNSIKGSAVFLSLFMSCELYLQRIITDNFKTQSNMILLLLQNCLKLHYSFTNITEHQLSNIKQLKLKCLALMYVKVCRTSTASALSFCHYLITTVQKTQMYLVNNNVPIDQWTLDLVQQLAIFKDSKPEAVSSLLFNLIKGIQLNNPPPCFAFDIGVCRAVISEPTGDAEIALKFTAGLVAGIHFDAEITSLSNTSLLRVKIKYPDQNTVLVLPRRSDLRHLGKNDYRLLTTVLLTHQVWTEPCYVDISLALAVAEEEGLASMPLPTEIDPYVIDLCKPVKVYVCPKPIKR